MFARIDLALLLALARVLTFATATILATVWSAAGDKSNEDDHFFPDLRRPLGSLFL